MPRLAFLFLPLAFYSVKAGETRWDQLQQSDYDVIMQRLELKNFNNLCVRNPKAGLVFYNRTQKAINISMNLLIDFTSNEATAHVQIYKFMSNEYRYFPITVNFNLCQEIARNSFAIDDILKKKSNITHCPIQKGFYYIANAVPDFSKWPPYIPLGEYKIEIKFYQRKNFVMELHGFTLIKDKPMKEIA